MLKFEKDTIGRYVKSLREKSVTPNEIKRKLQSIKRFLYWTVTMGYLDQNDFKQISQEIAKTVDSSITDKSPVISIERSEWRDPSTTLGMTNFNIQNYIAFAVVLLLISLIGFGLYNQFFKKTATPFAYPAALTPGSRIISFQGRLTDSIGNPIIAPIDLTYNFYTVSTGGSPITGSTRVCTASPDQDGIFANLIGSDPGPSCTPELPATIFSENPQVWLGVTVGSELTEMSPRQQIANVGYAMNAETLQGFPPGTTTSSIPFISTQGDLLIAAATPGIRSTYTTANFVISSAKTTTIQSANAGDIVLSATDGGALRFNTFNGSLVERITVLSGGNVGISNVNPLAALDVIGSASLSANLSFSGASTQVSQLNGGNISFATSVGGDAGATTKMTLTNLGNLGIGSTSPSQKLDITGNATLSGTLALGPQIPGYAGTCDATAAGKMYYDGIQNNYYFCNGITWTQMGSGGVQYWSRGTGVLYPTTTTDGVAATTSATTVATFTATGSNDAARIGGSTNYATINASGNLTFTNAGIATITGPTTGLTIDATTGAMNFGTSANARTITIGNATTTTGLALDSGTGDIVLTSTDQVKLNSSKAAGGTTTEALSLKSTIDLGVADELLQIGDSGADFVTILGNGNVGIGTALPLEKLDIVGNASMSGNLTIGQTGVLRSQYGPLNLAYKSALDTWTTGLTLQDTTGNVGIGSANPGAFKLEVAGNIGPEADNTRNIGGVGKAYNTIYVNNIIGAGSLGYWSRGTGVLYPTTTTDGVAATTSATTVATFTATGSNDAARIGGSTNYATINASGNLTFTNAGIATITGPTTGLTIDATTGAMNFGTSANARTITIGNATTTTGLALDSGTGDIVLTSTDQVKLNSSKAAGGTTTEALSLKSTIDLGVADELLQIGDSGADFVTILGNGNVGIGTALPLEKLDIVGNASMSGNLTIGQTGVLRSQYGPLNLAYKSGLDAWATGLTLQDTTGNVGIGSSNPVNALDVNGVVNVATGYRIANAATSGNFLRGNGTNFISSAILSGDIPSGSTYYIQNQTAGDQAADFRINGNGLFNGGNVGIGSLTPAEKLDIVGNASMSGNLTIGQTGVLRSQYGPLNLAYKSGLNAWTTGLTLQDTTGNVGIGTTGPAAKLEIAYPGLSSTALKVSGVGSTYYAQYTTASDGVLEYDFVSGGGNAANFEITQTNAAFANPVLMVNNGGGASSTSFRVNDDGTTTDSTPFLIDATGNVGIGTTTVTAKLDVAGDASTSGHLVFRGTTPNYIHVLNGTDLRISTSPGGDAGNVDRLTLLANGNVGIGTTAPSQLFHIQKAASDYFQYGSNPRAYLLAAAGNNGLRIDADATPLDVRTLTANGPTFNINGTTIAGTFTAANATAGLTTQSSPTLWFTGNYWTGAANATAFQGSIYAKVTSAAANGGGLSLGGSGGSDHMFIQASTGNVGIGTTAPGAKLDVKNTALIGSSATTRASLGLTVATSDTTTFVANTDVGDGARMFSVVNDSSTANTMAILSMRSNPGGGANNQMLDMKLVNDGAGASKLIYSFGPAGSFTDRVTFQSSGNVGIGSTSPGALLDVNGTFRNSTNVNGTGDPGIAVTSGNRLGFDESGTRSWTTKATGGNLDFYSGDSAGYHRFRTTGLLVDGSVGIGTTSPAATSLLDLTSTAKGFLAPRMTTVQRDAIVTPATGLMIYNTTTNAYNVYNGTSWGTIGGGVAGSGTLNYVAKWTPDGSTLGNSIIFDNGTNVGISSAVPGTKLDVAGTGRFSNVLTLSGGVTGAAPTPQLNLSSYYANAGTSASGPSHIVLYDTTDKYGFGVSGGTMDLWSGGAFKFNKYTGGVASSLNVIIDSGGNVGIGTTSPLGKLSLEGSYPQLTLNNPSAGSGVEIRIFDAGIMRQKIGHMDSTQRLQFATGGTDASGTGLSTRMTIDQNGNVGIGTTNPNYFTIVEKNDGVSSGEHLLFNVRKAVNSGELVLGYRADGASVTSTLIRSGNSAPLTFGTTSTNQAVTIIDNGNVGIGTTAPTQLLQVGPNSGIIAIGDGLTANGTSRLKFTSSNTVTNWQISNNDSTSGALEFMPSTVAGGKTFTTPAMLISSTGNVGIGTTSTALGKLQIYAAGDGTNALTITGSSTGTAMAVISQEAADTNTGTLKLYSGNPGVLGTLISGGTASSYFNGGGNVGIGTTGPGYKLDVQDTEVIANFSGASGNPRIQIGKGAYFTVFGAATDYGYWVESGQAIGSGINLKGGNVGIGSTAPTAKLDVAGNLNVQGYATASASLSIGGFNAPGGVGNALFSGNVGIGTSSPTSRFFVNLGANQLARFNDGTNASGATFQNGSILSQSSQFQIAATSTNPLSFYTGATINSMTPGTERIRVATGGNVGIGGALNTNAQLDLNGGTILAGQFCPTSTCQRYIVPNGVSRIDQLEVASDLPNNTGYISFLDANNSYVPIASISAQATGTVVIDNTATNITDVGYPSVPDLCIGDPYWCTGKVDAGTIDPPYTINGKKYATFLTAMTGVKEETTGTVSTNFQFEIRNLKSNSNGEISKGYAVKVIDFNDLPEASDLWLFSKTTNLRKNLGKMTVLLTPSDDTRTWYKVDNATHSLIIYSSRPTTVSYRLTAPRFDGERWTNENPGGSGGFELNDPDQPSLVTLNQVGNIPAETFTISPLADSDSNFQFEIRNLKSMINFPIFKVISDKTGDFIEEVGVFAQITVGQIKAGFIETENAIVNNMLLAKNILVQEKIISPVVETTDLTATGTATLTAVQTNEIQPKNDDLTIDLDRPNGPNLTSQVKKGALGRLIVKGLNDKTVASIDAEGNATFAGTLTASEASLSGTLTAQAVVASSSSFLSSNVEHLTSENASISGKLIAREIESDTINELTGRTAAVEERSGKTAEVNQGLAENINIIQQELAQIKNAPLPNANYYQNIDTGEITSPLQDLTVTGNSNLYNASVANSLTAGNIFIQNNEILSLSWELKLSALAQITLFDGSVTIAKNGNITTQGEVIAKGGVRTDTIQPTENSKNLTVKLSGRTPAVKGGSNEVGGGTAEVNENGKLKIENSVGNEVASIDASGSARFNALGFNQIATNSALIADSGLRTTNDEIIPAMQTNAEAAGQGILPLDAPEIIIYNDKITKDSLVYLTKTGDTGNEPLTVVKKEVGERPYFSVSSGNSIHPEIKFNWLIIN